MIASPKVDQRTAEDLVAQVRTLLAFHAPELDFEEDSQAGAMARIFARYAELTIDRLNRAPEKNFLAFLNLAGVTPLPPRAASVPLTFYLSAQSTESVVVPALTQVAAELAKGEKKPVLFETESELVVVPARVESFFYKNGERDLYRNWKTVVGPAVPPALDHMAANASSTAETIGGACDSRPIPHVLFVGIKQRVRWPAKNELRLRFVMHEDGAASPEAQVIDPRVVQWELCSQAIVQSKQPPDAADERAAAIVRSPISPQEDETEGLTKSGQVVFHDLRQPSTVEFGGFFGVWLSCRLITPLTRDPKPRSGMVRSQQILPVQDLKVEFEFDEDGVPMDLLFFNAARIDATKEFFPFGERPKFGDTFYLASEAFSDADARVEVEIELTNARDNNQSPIPPVAPQGVKLGWEFWDGQQWARLGVGDTEARAAAGHVRFVHDSENAAAEESDFVDATKALTLSGAVSFGFSSAPAPCVVNGKRGYWVRVRILLGGYGTDATYERNEANGQYTVTPASFAPPSIRSIKAGVIVNAESRPAAITTFNDFAFQRVEPGASFQPFVPTTDEDLSPSLYLGFMPTKPLTVGGSTAPLRAGLTMAAFPGRSMSVYVSIAQGPQPSEESSDSSQPLNAIWEYWNGTAWTKWTVRDGTLGLERSGILRVLAPADVQLKDEFGVGRYWLRMRKGRANFDPQVGNVLLNTTMAREGMTMTGEILGASNGRGDQRFHTAQAPVLSGQRLEVREPRRLTSQEERVVIAEEGLDAIRPATAAEGANGHVWVRWHEVPNLNGSTARDRHYMLDRLTGEVRFGDGANGQIPPALPGNVRMPIYRTGGGVKGNKPPLTIKQMKTAVPSVTVVLNWAEAGGGGEAETTAALLERGPHLLRHGNRAVTPEDFEDLAMASSSEVAKAKCFPLLDVRKKIADQRSEPGVVSMILLPQSTALAPEPSEELLATVEAFLRSACSPTVRLVLAGPRYMPVDVETEAAVDDPDIADDVELGITLALQNYLHPVTGGRDGRGWELGREPHKSDLWVLIGKIPGVSHVRSLKIGLRRPAEAKGNGSQCLICAGSHKVSVTLQE